MDTIGAALFNEVYVAIVMGITACSAFGGAWFAIVGAVNWYQASQFQGDATPVQIATDLFIASVLLGITALFAANGGMPFQGSPGGYAVVQFQSGVAGDATGAANSLLSAGFAMLAAIGWLSQLRGALAARELGRGRSDMTIWRVLGFIVGGAILADLSTGVKYLDATFQAGLFS